MSDSVLRKEKWSLSSEAFEALLQALSTDRATAALRYERIRTKLIKYFVWERRPFAEDCVDETINRVARRILEGEEVLNPDSYFYGVARLVMKERVAQAHRETRAAEVFARQAAVHPDPDSPDAISLECLDSCLAELAGEQRSFILQYYSGEKRLRIENRQRMAAALNLDLNALRNRALRLREKVEACVLKCAERKRS